jgi:sugar fermentation stimulation protein A
VQTRTRPPLDATDRLARHVTELGASLTAEQRAILLICFLYDNPGFQVQPSRHHATVKAQVAQAIRRGVEIWQVNFHVDAVGARVLSYNELTPQLS